MNLKFAVKTLLFANHIVKRYTFHRGSVLFYSQSSNKKFLTIYFKTKRLAT